MNFSDEKKEAIQNKIRNTCEKNKANNPNYYNEIKEKRHRTNIERHGSATWNNPEKTKQTCIQKYGVENPFQSNEIKQKIKNTNKEKYGVEMPMQSKQIQEKSKNTKLEKYGDPNFTNREKSAVTCLEKYGNSCYLASDEGRQKVESTNIKKYGVKSSLQAIEIQNKIKTTNLERYGVENVFAAPEIQNKIKNTLIEKYGVDHPSKCKNINSKIQTARSNTCALKYNSNSYWGSEEWKRACIAKFGGLSPSCDPEIQKKMFHRYEFDNQKFDSSYELAAYIYFKDHEIPFKFHDFDGLPYEFDGKKFLYFRDFDVFIDGKWRMIEIKGDHFFAIDGKMKCPFRNSNWTDEFYNYMCAKYEAKHQCMLQNNVKILKTSEEECQRYMNYIKTSYGRNFINNHKCNH